DASSMSVSSDRRAYAELTTSAVSAGPYTLHFGDPFHQLVVQVPKRELIVRRMDRARPGRGGRARAGARAGVPAPQPGRSEPGRGRRRVGVPRLTAHLVPDRRPGGCRGAAAPDADRAGPVDAAARARTDAQVAGQTGMESPAMSLAGTTRHHGRLGFHRYRTEKEPAHACRGTARRFDVVRRARPGRPLRASAPRRRRDRLPRP